MLKPRADSRAEFLSTRLLTDPDRARAEPFPDDRRQTWDASHRKIDRVHRVASPNRPNRTELPGSAACGVWGEQ
jgi:hypothetical protein